MAEYPLLTKDFGADDLQTLKGYERTGGYQGLRDAFKKFTPETLDRRGEDQQYPRSGRRRVPDRE